MEAAVESARRHPLAHAAGEEGLRRAVAHRFPYGVFFSLEDDTVVVLGVFHAARDPSTWRTRR